MSKGTERRARKAVELIRMGADDETIRLATGYSHAVIQALRDDIERHRIPDIEPHGGKDTGRVKGRR